MSPILWSFTIGGQLIMFCLFFHESIVTNQGKICRVKCGLAAGLYFAFVVMLVYGLYKR